ncbi:MAG: ferritin [Thermoanaerobaculia bacterium]
MISPTMQDALNAQISSEQYSAQLYLAMSAHCAGKSFKGFAHWLRIQAFEETAHAAKLIQFLLDRAGRLQLRPIPAPPAEFGTVIEVFEKTLEHEKAVTAKISALFDLARREGDYASEITLQWYVTEQVEEEANISEIVDQLHAVGVAGGAIWYLDSKMGKRTQS